MKRTMKVLDSADAATASSQLVFQTAGRDVAEATTETIDPYFRDHDT